MVNCSEQHTGKIHATKARRRILVATRPSARGGRFFLSKSRGRKIIRSYPAIRLVVIRKRRHTDTENSNDGDIMKKRRYSSPSRRTSPERVFDETSETQNLKFLRSLVLSDVLKRTENGKNSTA